MIVGVSHRLLPMFLLAHQADTRWTKRALCGLAVGVPGFAAGLATGRSLVAWLGVVALELGFACFVRQAVAFHRARVRKRLDVGMWFAATGVASLIVAATLGPIVLALGARHARLATTYVAIGVLGGVVMYVVGFFYKIVPLLAWTVRYRSQLGVRAVPTVAELFSARVAQAQLGIMGGGVALLVIGIAAGSSAVTRSGALFYACGVLVFTSQIVRVVRGDSTTTVIKP